jgi:hypothetical protein
MSNEKDQVAEALVREFGLETDAANDVGELDEFFKDAMGSEPETAEPVAEKAPAKFVHEPTGREFDSEVDFLRYDAGWKNDQWGRKFKELEERFSSAPEPKAPASEQKSLTKRELIDKLFANQPEEYRSNPVAEFVLEGIDNALAIYGGQQQQVIQGLQETVAKLEGRLQESSLRAQYGVDQSVEQKLVEKHSWLKGISDPAARMAAMKDLIGKQAAPETVSPKLMDRVPRRAAEDHVEGSVREGITDTDGMQALEKRLFEAPDQERLSIFGKLFERSDMAGRLSGDKNSW